MVPIIATAALKGAETSIWWYFTYVAGAGGGGYYWWRWWNGGPGLQRQEMPEDTPINETARQSAETNTQVNHDLGNQTHINTVSETILQDVTDDEAEIDSIVDELESKQEEVKVSQASFKSLLERILNLTELYDERNHSISAELTELNKIFSKEELGQLKNVYRLIEQNSALSQEIEQYKLLVEKLTKVVNVLKKDTAMTHQPESKLESTQAKFGI